MDPSHFRGWQPPSSHAIPGALGRVLDHPPAVGFTGQPPAIPPVFLNQLIETIRGEFSSQHSRLEKRLEDIHHGVLQLHENQVAAITAIRERLENLEGLAQVSRVFLDAGFSDLAKTVEQGFESLAMITEANSVCNQLQLPPQRGSSADTNRPAADSDTLQDPPHTPMQDELNEGLFGTSPLTQVSSPGSQDEEPQVSMIWPPVMEGSHEGPKYACECNSCPRWFHLACVGLQEHPQPDWKCPICVLDPERDTMEGFTAGEVCSRPGCSLSEDELHPQTGEYFIERLVGRRYVPAEGVVKYLVLWDGWDISECTWEPPEHFNDPSKIQELLDSWGAENPSASVELLRPNDTIFLREVHHLAAARTVKWAQEF